MNQNNFFIQIFFRLFSKNPKFFQIIQIISLVCAAIAGLPELFSYFGVTLPAIWVSYENLAVAKAALVVAFIAQLPKQDPPATGTSSGTSAAAKVLVILVFASICSLGANAQSFFSRLPKYAPPQKAQLNDMAFAPRALIYTAPVTDSIYNAFRPIVVAAAYSEPGNILMAGIGVAYQHVDYNYATQLTSVKWEVAGVGFAGGSVIPNSIASIVTAGILGGLPIQGVPILAGPDYNFGAPKGNKIGFAITATINLNN
jgi:hypothetical protein